MSTPQTDYDVIIIGAGPAGSAAGAALGRAGKRVLIVEKAPFEPYRIGESLLPNGNALLRSIGVWEKVEAAGFVKKYGAEFETGDGATRVENIFANGLRPDLPYSYQVDRPRFDTLLLDHARDCCGCRTQQDADVVRVETRDDGCQIETRDGRKWSARWLIDASGRRRLLGQALRLPSEPNPYPSRIAIYNHFKNVARKSGPAGGNIIITRLPRGWFWQIPVSADTTSVGLVTLAADLRRSGMTPEEWFQHQVAQSPAVTSRLSAATAVCKFRTTTDYSYMFTDFAGPRFLLVGDAATFSDPVFSSGVYLSLESALNASRAILKADAQQRPLTAREQKRYTNALKQSTQVVRRLIDTFYNDSGFAVFMNPTNRFKLFPAINTIVAGNTRPAFNIRWRYALFLLICRLNKSYRLVPPVLKRRREAIPDAQLRNAASSGNTHR